MEFVDTVFGVAAVATGGQHHRVKFNDQNLDTYAVEYRFDAKTKFCFSSQTIKDGVRRLGDFGQRNLVQF